MDRAGVSPKRSNFRLRGFCMSPFPSSPSHSSDATNWQDLYRAALLELDPTKLAQRVGEAEAVVAARANQLFQDGDGNGEESEALNDTLCALRALRLKVQHVASGWERWRDERCLSNGSWK